MSVLTTIVRVRRRYREIHGAILTKGLSFSLILASVPLLFLLLVAGSFLVTPQLVDVVEGEFLGFLPTSVRANLVSGIERYARSPGSLSVVTVAVFLLAVHNLFVDLQRTISLAIGRPIAHGRARLAALAANALFLVFVYAATIISAAGRWIVRLSDLNPTLLPWAARGLSATFIAVVFYAVFRAGARARLRFRPTAAIALGASVVWQLVLAAGGRIVDAAGTRFLAYGVLAWAVVFLVFMRLMAEILIHGALLVRERALPLDAMRARSTDDLDGDR
ncbi:MAG: YihY/virulence factor BrkB family protein [Spirochaetaceae bacterium]